CTRISIVASILALTSAAAAQPAPAQPAPAPAPAAPPAAPAPAPAAPPAAEAAPAAAPVEAAPAPAPVPEPAVAPAPAAEEEAKPAAPEKLAVGKEGLWQPGGLFQIWLLNQNQDDDNVLSFRVRRAELRFKGEIVPKLVGYGLMADFAKILEFAEEDVDVDSGDPAVPSPGTVAVDQPRSNYYSPLQDVFITFMSEYADVSVGQYKIPVSWEGVNSSSKVLFPERSLVSRYYGDRRDVGLKAEKKLFDEHLYYYLGLFNGAGQNRFTDNDDQKDLALRLEGYPIKGVMVGAVGYMGLNERDVSNTKDRVEGDVRVELYNALLQAEYIHGWDGPTDADRVEGHGFYVAGGYTFLDRIQPIVRVGYLDQNIDADAQGGDQTLSYEGGFNYYLRGQEARLAATVGFFDDKLEGEPTRTDVTLFAQMSF
ncbi:MAG TPA: porin, partial [Polyangiaceae bacterium]|nr:porin [Polyangiaceae bacterium]